MVSPLKKGKLIKGKKYVCEEKETKSKYSYKPLLNRKFYLDLPNYSGIESLKQELIHLGAILEGFVEKEVNCIVTTRSFQSSVKDSSSDASQQQPSSALINPNSLSGHKLPSSVPSVSCKSPSALDSSKGEGIKRRALIRSDSLLEKARLKRKGTSDVLENARLFSIPIWSLSKLLRHLESLKKSPLYQPRKSTLQKKNNAFSKGASSSSTSSSSSSGQCQHLKSPFIKIEGFKREFKPHYKELQEWPRLNLRGSSGKSPFADPEPTEPKPANKNPTTDKRPKTDSIVHHRPKPGYCELCSCNYSDLKRHLSSQSHVAFVRNDKNYLLIDAICDEYHIDKYSRFIQEGKLDICKAAIHTRLHKHLVYELGETLYSGPPSGKREGDGSSPLSSKSSPHSESNPHPPDCALLNDDDYNYHSLINCSSSSCSSQRRRRSSSSNDSNKGALPVPSSSSSSSILDDHLGNPGGGDGDLLKFSAECNGTNWCRDEELNISSKLDSTELHFSNSLANPSRETSESENYSTIIGGSVSSEIDFPPSPPPPPLPSRVDLVNSSSSSSSAEMVRLIQEPKSDPPHSLRRNVRNVKRSGSVESVVNNSSSVSSNNISPPSTKPCNKFPPKELRRGAGAGATATACGRVGIFDDSGGSECNGVDLATKEKLPSIKRTSTTKNGGAVPYCDHHHHHRIDSIPVCKVVNGVGRLKARSSSSRDNSEEPEEDPPTRNSPNSNAHCTSAGGADNESVDINLLLEISAKDREKFETKKAKIKRKCADWMLISETERYYNEKEAILRNKHRGGDVNLSSSDSDSSSSSSEMCEKTKGQHHHHLPPPPPPSCSTADIKPTLDNAKPGASKRGTRYQVRDKKDHPRSNESQDCLIRNIERRNCRASNRSRLEDDGVNTGAVGDSPATESLASPKPRKRLSDAERFLRDNREYYMFTETRERLRSNTVVKNNLLNKNCSKFNNRLTIKEEEVIDLETITEDSPLGCRNLRKPLRSDSSALEPPVDDGAASKKRTRRTSLRLSTEGPQSVVVRKDPAAISPKYEMNETLDDLYFSFEGAPVQEPWFQTYQRYIDDEVGDTGFKYEKDPLKFVLPYEMPKEYFRELYLKKTLLSKKKVDLLDLTRKSPRCHASTLALFSNFISSSSKKKGKATKSEKETTTSRSKAEDASASSSGCNTPTLELPPPKVQMRPSYFESEEELLFIGQCMDHVMQSTINEGSKSGPDSKSKGTKSKAQRRGGPGWRRKGLKKSPVNALKPIKVVNIPMDEPQIFNNDLASEIDSQFLLDLPTYLDHVSLFPEDILTKESGEVMNDSSNCECSSRLCCDDASSLSGLTEDGSERLSVGGGDSETVDGSVSSSYSAATNGRRKLPPSKKRRINLTGWPKRKKRRLIIPSCSKEEEDSAQETTPKSPRKRIKRRNYDLLEPCSSISESPSGSVTAGDLDRRSSSRKKSCVLYVETWPLRFRRSKW